MSERKIKVPDGMLEYGQKAYGNLPDNSDDPCETIIEAALQCLAENPIVPTEEQAQYMYDGKNGCGHSATIQYCMVEWQRRMFLAPEPEPDPMENLKAQWIKSIDDIFFMVKPEIRNTAKDQAIKAIESVRHTQKAGR
jgi:hypothetical protein